MCFCVYGYVCDESQHMYDMACMLEACRMTWHVCYAIPLYSTPLIHIHSKVPYPNIHA